MSKENETPGMSGYGKIKLIPFEIYSRNFSQVIISSSLVDAVIEFERVNPNEEIIFAEHTEAVKEERAPTPAATDAKSGCKELVEALEKIVETCDGWKDGIGSWALRTAQTALNNYKQQNQ